MTDNSDSTIVPRRSALYLPGSNPRALDKAHGLPADVLIIDLEDAVAPERKAEARIRVAEHLDEGGYAPRECVVRVNGLDSPWCGDDLTAVAALPITAVLFPKVGGVTDVQQAVRRMDGAGIDSGVSLWIMAETTRGILNIAAIAGASDRIRCIVVGTSDLAKEMRVPHTPGRLGLLAPLSQCVLAARAVGVDVLDGVYLDLGDPQGFRRSCEQGRNLGFDGKTLIHPDQIAHANATFAPSAAEVERARRVVDAWRRADASGAGVAVVDGRLVERLHVEEAQRVLALDAAIGERGF